MSFNIEGRKVTAPQEPAEIQLTALKNKTNKLISHLPQTVDDPLSYLQEAMNDWDGKNSRETFNIREVTKLETLGVINKLGYSNSMANDNLDVMVIKHGASQLHCPITHIVNLSIAQSKFAAKWKIGRLLPLHKGKGLAHDDPASYRLISLLPVI